MEEKINPDFDNKKNVLIDGYVFYFNKLIKQFREHTTSTLFLGYLIMCICALFFYSGFYIYFRIRILFFLNFSELMTLWIRDLVFIFLISFLAFGFSYFFTQIFRLIKNSIRKYLIVQGLYVVFLCFGTSAILLWGGNFSAKFFINTNTFIDKVTVELKDKSDTVNLKNKYLIGEFKNYVFLYDKDKNESLIIPSANIEYIRTIK